jgi:asparagine synthase (glutamine-hydrolysing)
MNLDPEQKMIHKGPDISKADTKIEKWVVRKAFDTPDDPYLPDEILWRQKEQFSDGECDDPPCCILSHILFSFQSV